MLSECDAGRKAIQRAALQRRIVTSLTFTGYKLTMYKACCRAHSFDKGAKSIRWSKPLLVPIIRWAGSETAVTV